MHASARDSELVVKPEVSARDLRRRGVGPEPDLEGVDDSGGSERATTVRARAVRWLGDRMLWFLILATVVAVLSRLGREGLGRASSIRSGLLTSDGEAGSSGSSGLLRLGDRQPGKDCVALGSGGLPRREDFRAFASAASRSLEVLAAMGRTGSDDHGSHARDEKGRARGSPREPGQDSPRF